LPDVLDKEITQGSHQGRREDTYWNPFNKLFVLIPAACNDAFSSSDCTMSDERIILSDEFGGMWKEAVVALI